MYVKHMFEKKNLIVLHICITSKITPKYHLYYVLSLGARYPLIDRRNGFELIHIQNMFINMHHVYVFMCMLMDDLWVALVE